MCYASIMKDMSDNREDRFTIRFTGAEYLNILSQSAQKNKTVSEYIRGKVFSDKQAGQARLSNFIKRILRK